MKRCPTCKQTFTEDHLTFCLDDGTPLVPVNDEAEADATPDSTADEATVVRSAAPSTSPDSGSSSGSSDSYGSSAAESSVPPYQRPGAYVPPDYTGQSGQSGKRRALPWVLGCAVVLVGSVIALAITAKILYPRITVGEHTENSNVVYNWNTNHNANVNRNESNSNSASNSSDWNENSNSTGDNTTPAPTNEAKVLADLTELEHEWTVANINADKKKLNLILADDYVATLPNGNLQGKAEYLRTAERDDATQKWDMQDLKLTLRGDRATLTGVLQLEVRNQRGENQSLSFRFIDKFVWRDGRWQATASEVQPVKREGVSA